MMDIITAYFLVLAIMEYTGLQENSLQACP